MNIVEKIVEIFSEVMEAPKETVTPEVDLFNDLGVDDIDLIEVLMEIEERFGVYIPDEELGKIKTVGDIVKLVEAKTA